MTWAADYLIKQAFGRMVGGATEGALMPGMGPRIEMQGSSVTPQPVSGSRGGGSPLAGYQSLGSAGGLGGAGGMEAAGPGAAGTAWDTAKGIGGDLLNYWVMGKVMGGGAPASSAGGAATRAAGKAATRPAVGAATRAAGGAATRAAGGAATRPAAGAAARRLGGGTARTAAGWGSKALGAGGTALKWGGKALGLGGRILGGPIGWAYTLGDLAATGGNMYLDAQEANTRKQQATNTTQAVNQRNAEILSGKHDWRYTTPQQQQQLMQMKARLQRQRGG